MSESAGTRTGGAAVTHVRNDASGATALARVVLASNNAGKLREFDAMLGAAGI